MVENELLYDENEYECRNNIITQKKIFQKKEKQKSKIEESKFIE